MEKERRREEWEIDTRAAEEKQEIRNIYEGKGFKDRLLDEVVRVITARRKVWVDTMMGEELGLIKDMVRPIDTAATTFVAFNATGIIPLIPFIFALVRGPVPSTRDVFLYSMILTYCVGILSDRGLKG